MKSLHFVFWDQLSFSLASLKNIEQDHTVLMCELRHEATRVPHHPKKIALWFAAMRHFAQQLRDKGINVRYVYYDDPLNTHHLTEEINRALQDLFIEKIIITEPSEYRLQEIVRSWEKLLNVVVEIHTDDRFLCTKQEFSEWASHKKELRMEYFYRQMRRRYNILIEPDGSPTGGLWNYDKENRKPPSSNIAPVKRVSHKKSEILQEVLDLVHNKFNKHFGDLDPFHYAVTRAQALIELDHFMEHILPQFGDYQDAMLLDNAYVYHSLLSSYINIGLLLPLEICHKAETVYRKGNASIHCVEGFIRQILGWREFIRGIYWHNMPGYAELNALNATNPLPAFYWGGKTHMRCIAEAVSHTKIHAYSHHIQRLMITGNFALLAGLDVKEVQEWYLCVYSDAYEWVEMPNTLGMALFGDGGIVASKPYAASGQYIHKMSNFCKKCPYDVKDMTGEKACPFNALYWNFLYQHRALLQNNHRLAFMYSMWDKFTLCKKEAILKKAALTLNTIKEGKI